MTAFCQPRPEEARDGLWIKVVGPDLNDENGAGLVEGILAQARRRARFHVYLDLNGIEHLGGCALTELLRLDRRLRAAGGRLSLRNLSPLVYEVFHICRLTELLDTEACS